MRIAQLAPLAESVPPKLYGGTERVIAWLIEELVALGHEVTLFASGDSRTKANLVPAWPRALRLGRPRADPAAAYCSRRSPKRRGFRRHPFPCRLAAPPAPAAIAHAIPEHPARSPR